ncbi:MAG: hypothetical protein KKA45_05130 [Alphaproteobacteria bacterium]|nr:hypothetical protein [Alphaproteobacteria bacterium]
MHTPSGLDREPRMAGLAAQDLTFALVVTALDPDFYRRAYPDVDAAGADPFVHYVEAGWREARDPAPWFSTAAYLADHPDVAESGRNPLAHFLQIGAQEGRLVRPSALAHRRAAAVRGERAAWDYIPPTAPPPPSESVRPSDGAGVVPGAPDNGAYDLVAAAFDHRFYLAENPDVAESGVDPVTHFLESGWREGRDPAPWFSVDDYQELNPDVAASGMHPFVHYLQAGRQEGRVARLELGFRYRILAALQPPETRVETAERYDVHAEPDDAQALADLLAQSRSGLVHLHLTFSHDDYSANLGGVQLCLQREAAAAAETGRDHLHIYPINPRPMLRRPGQAGLLGVVWNGVSAGVFSPSVLAEGLQDRLADVATGRHSLAIHSLLGHSVTDVLSIVRGAGLTQGWFWVHDFASACASYHLLRNDVTDCGAPPVGSAACGVCTYGPQRQFHLDEHERLFRALDLSVAAPSQAALDTWRRGANLPAAQTVVAPLAKLVARPPVDGPSAESGRPFRLAFPGLPSPLKGWPVFRDLVLKFAEDPRYEFLHLARDPAAGLPLTFHPVTVTQDDPKAMQGALEALEVDAVMIWSLCRETFSFTTHEAAAAGAAILTGPDSGNVAAFVASTGLGEVIADEAALFELFESGEIVRLSRARRAPALADLAYSRLTIDLLDGEDAR